MLNRSCGCSFISAAEVKRPKEPLQLCRIQAPEGAHCFLCVIICRGWNGPELVLSLNLWISLMDTIYVPIPVQHHFGNLHKYCQIKMSNQTNLRINPFYILSRQKVYISHRSKNPTIQFIISLEARLAHNTKIMKNAAFWKICLILTEGQYLDSWSYEPR